MEKGETLPLIFDRINRNDPNQTIIHSNISYNQPASHIDTDIQFKLTSKETPLANWSLYVE